MNHLITVSLCYQSFKVFTTIFYWTILLLTINIFIIKLIKMIRVNFYQETVFEFKFEIVSWLTDDRRLRQGTIERLSGDCLVKKGLMDQLENYNKQFKTSN